MIVTADTAGVSVDAAASAARRVGLALAGAGCFVLAFPPFDLGIAFGPLAVTFLALAVRDLVPRRAAAIGALFGFVAAQGVFHWVYRVAAFGLGHGVLLGGYLALWPALFAALLARQGAERRGLLVLPIGGAVLEWARAHAGFLAFPWMTFGQTQHRNVPLLQLAAFGGELLVGMVVVLVGVALAQLVSERGRSRAAFVALGVAGLCHLLGLARLARPAEGDAVVVAAVQPAASPGARDEAETDAVLARTADLSRAAVQAGARLVVWPESAVSDLDGDLATKLAVREIVEDVGVPVVLGSSHLSDLAARSAPAARKPTNAAFVMEPHTPVAAPYAKVRLLPFAEVVPQAARSFVSSAPFETEPGSHRTTLRAGDLTIEPVICWENLFADDVRSTASDEPTIIAHLVNDAWFGPTSAAAMHDLVSVVRAVENDRPVVVASNAGPSQIIDARGRIVARAEAVVPRWIAGTVTLPGGQTPYRRLGDGTWAAPSVVLLLARRARRRRCIAVAAEELVEDEPAREHVRARVEITEAPELAARARPTGRGAVVRQAVTIPSSARLATKTSLATAVR